MILFVMVRAFLIAILNHIPDLMYKLKLLIYSKKDVQDKFSGFDK